MIVGLLGHGVVGKGVSSILDRQDDSLIKIKRILVKDESEMVDPRTTINVEDIYNDAEIDIVVECMGGLEPAHTFVRKALESGKHVVTSNKKMLATYFKELNAIAKEKGVNLAYEASVGGGIPWIDNLFRIRRFDEVASFRGIFNGTTNFILDCMNADQKDFASALKEAQSLGYAEKDPSDDIDGYDVRYKVCISAVAAFDTYIEPEKIPTFGIRHICRQDLSFCKDNQYVCKMIGSAYYQDQSVQAYVMPVFLKKEDVLANVFSNYNAITCTSDTLGPAMFFGQGAGSLPTAHAVVQDIFDIVHHKDGVCHELKEGQLSDTQEKVFYVRTSQKECFKDIINEEVNENTFLTKPVKLFHFLQLLDKVEDTSIFVAEVQHD